jgi:hypothetical protein
MPVDPATGEALPYPEDEKPNEDIQEMLDAADAIIGGEEAPVEEAPVEDEAPPEENAEGVDLAPIEEALDIDSTAAAELWEAAQERDDLAAMTPEELGAALAEDFGLRMQLEKAIASKADAGMEEMMPMEEAPPMEEIPMGGPEGMMPPGM